VGHEPDYVDILLSDCLSEVTQTPLFWAWLTHESAHVQPLLLCAISQHHQQQEIIACFLREAREAPSERDAQVVVLANLALASLFSKMKPCFGMCFALLHRVDLSHIVNAIDIFDLAQLPAPSIRVATVEWRGLIEDPRMEKCAVRAFEQACRTEYTRRLHAIHLDTMLGHALKLPACETHVITSWVIAYCV
jgi:hypothetical protein